MGLSNKGGGGKTYVNILSSISKFAVKSKEGVEGVVSRENKNGAVVYELLYNSLSAFVKNLSITDSQFGENIELEMEDVNGENFCLQIGWGNFSVRNSFVNRLPNIDFTEELEFVIFEDKDNKKPVFLIKQNGGYVKYAYTNDKPNGRPAPKVKKVRGKEEVDYSEQENFLYEILKNKASEFNGDVPADTEVVATPEADGEMF